MTILATTVFIFVVWYYLHRSAYQSKDQWERVDRAMEVVLPAVTSMLGTVLGFYFGSQKR